MTFTKTSKDITLRFGCVLSATCTAIDGTPKESLLDLNECIGNDGAGRLKWGGKGYTSTADRVSIKGVNNRTVLVCSMMDAQGNLQDSELLLDARIENNNGKLEFMPW